MLRVHVCEWFLVCKLEALADVRVDRSTGEGTVVLIASFLVVEGRDRCILLVQICSLRCVPALGDMPQLWIKHLLEVIRIILKQSTLDLGVLEGRCLFPSGNPV